LGPEPGIASHLGGELVEPDFTFLLFATVTTKAMTLQERERLRWLRAYEFSVEDQADQKERRQIG
jgi:hypothetical protein